MKQINQSKLTAKKILLMAGILIAGFQVQAQKVGDNLGNHTANQDLKMAGNNIVNVNKVTATDTVAAKNVTATNNVSASNIVTSANGMVIGAATFTNANVSLELKGDSKAILINRVTDTLAAYIALPVDGMMIYSNAQSRFYFRSNGIWQTFASSPSGKAVLSITAGAVPTTPAMAISNANGFSMTNSAGAVTGAASGDVTITLQPASSLYPGIVTADLINPQTFNGSKIFAGNLTFGSVPSSTDTADKVLVLDGSGNVKATVVTAASMIMKTTCALTAAQLTGKFTSPNSYATLAIPVPGIKMDDGVVVNFLSADLLAFEGLTIKNAVASADGIVTVQIEDDRNPVNDPSATPPYVYSGLPVLLGMHLTITWLHAK